jgi:hypothetical protein
VFLFERAHGGHGKNALDAEFLESINIGAEVEL